MRDILSQGEEREPIRWPPRLASAAVLAVLLTVALVHYLPGLGTPSRSRPGPRPPRASKLRPGRRRRCRCRRASRTGSSGRPRSATAPAAAGRRGAAGLVLAGRRAHRADRRPAREPSGYQFTRIGGGWALQPGSDRRTSCGGCAGEVAQPPVYFLADRAPSVTRVGTADQGPRGRRPGRSVADQLPGANRYENYGRYGAGSERRGRAAGRPLRLPAGYRIDQATDRGLLLVPVIQQDGTAPRLWRPGAQRGGRLFPGGVVAASPSEIAWTARCTTVCHVQVLHLATGRVTAVGLPAGTSPRQRRVQPGRCLPCPAAEFRVRRRWRRAGDAA